ncbi:MAG: 50S ribosomal protein L10, partial [Bacteroidetes bacterium]
DLDTLAGIKSKEELIGDLLALLQSPMQTLVGQLQSGGSTIMNLLKALEERAD